MGALHSWRTRRRSSALRPLMLRSMSNRASMRLTASSATGEIAGAFFARRALLRLRNAAAQTRIVSAARIRLDSGKFVRPFKQIICGDISEFESHMPSQAVRSPEANMRTPLKTARYRSNAIVGRLAASYRWRHSWQHDLTSVSPESRGRSIAPWNGPHKTENAWRTRRVPFIDGTLAARQEGNSLHL